jgi:hypothetical protein
MREARVIETIKAGEVALRVVGATELERLLQADKITREQFDTGERLRELWYASGLDGYGASWHGCACTDVRRGSRFECMSEKQEHAWRTYACHAQPSPCVPPRSRAGCRARRDGAVLA